jgi:hypothetical protein
MTSTPTGRLARQTPRLPVSSEPAVRVTPARTTPSRVRGQEVAGSFPEAAPAGPARSTGDTRTTAEAKA